MNRPPVFRALVRFLALAAVLLLPAMTATGFAATPTEPEGYRGEPYRAEVPASLAGATTLDSEAAFALWEKGGAGFVDVLPRTPRPAGLPADTVWNERKRISIRGAIWLPNVGYENLAAETEDYFLAGLAAVSRGNRAMPLVFFCLEECWMSWNAAKRALAAGYEKIYWYPDGTDGWGLYDYPVERVLPWEEK